jgi:hypothetical protein
MDAMPAAAAVRDRSAGIGGRAGALSPEGDATFVRAEAARRGPSARACGATAA